MSIGNKINYAKAARIMRALRNMTQGELAKKASLDTSYISLLESGKRTPSAKALEKICKALAVPTYLILGVICFALVIWVLRSFGLISGFNLRLR